MDDTAPSSFATTAHPGSNTGLDAVHVPRAALEVLVGELAKHHGRLDAHATAALDAIRSALAGTRNAPATDGRHDTECPWRKLPTGSYRCAHGFESAAHPRGWCDQGCCR